MTSKRFVRGEHEVRIKLTSGKEKEYIPLGYSAAAADWDEAAELPRPTHPHYKELTKKINRYLDDIDFELRLAAKDRRPVSCIEVKRKILNQFTDQPGRGPQLKILEFFDKVIAQLEEDGRPGYADVFISTRSTVSKLLNNNRFIPPDEREHEKDMSFLAFTKSDHQRYERLISTGASESTISFYLRNYYRIWNMAIAEGLCTKAEHHPSKYIRFKPYKQIRTQKRSIKKDYLGEIIAASFEPGSRKHRSQLLAQFIYYARGINFGDMCKLRHTDIANGTIRYVRSKNHRIYDYTLHPKAQEVIDHFKANPVQSDAGYVFPILMARHDTPRKIKDCIKAALRAFNDDLKEMAKDVGWERKFTSYSLRHGFATHLRDSSVDISIIQGALGHETQEQTTVYLDELDDQPMADEINRALSFDKNKKKEANKKAKGKRRGL